jgi:hypothetical protein
LCSVKSGIFKGDALLEGGVAWPLEDCTVVAEDALDLPVKVLAYNE